MIDKAVNKSRVILIVSSLFLTIFFLEFPLKQLCKTKIRVEFGQNRVETGQINNRVEFGQTRVETGQNRVETGQINNRVEFGQTRVETGQKKINCLQIHFIPLRMSILTTRRNYSGIIIINSLKQILLPKKCNLHLRSNLQKNKCSSRRLKRLT